MTLALQPQPVNRLVWAAARSLAATYAIVVTFFSSGYLDVSVPRLPSIHPMCSDGSDGTVHPTGLPHSETLGSKCECHSPRHIAAYRVLHRPFVPRHPPCALGSLKLIESCQKPKSWTRHRSKIPGFKTNKTYLTTFDKQKRKLKSPSAHRPRVKSCKVSKLKAKSSCTLTCLSGDYSRLLPDAASKSPTC